MGCCLVAVVVCGTDVREWRKRDRIAGPAGGGDLCMSSVN